MIFQEFLPSPHLSKVIDSYWYFEWVWTNQRILPDGSIDIIIPLHKKEKSIVVGMMTTFADIEFNEYTRIFGIRFKPGMFHLFTDFSLYESRNTDIPASCIIPELSREIENIVSGEFSILENISKTEVILMKHIPRHIKTDSRIIVSCMEQILSSRWSMSIEYIAKSHSISYRNLQRKFHDSVGTSIKEMSRIIRFQGALKSIEKYKNLDIRRIALLSGYYDQAHMYHDFMEFSWKTPTHFQ